jgi:hypothetical protein
MDDKTRKATVSIRVTGKKDDVMQYFDRDKQHVEIKSVSELQRSRSENNSYRLFYTCEFDAPMENIKRGE